MVATVIQFPTMLERDDIEFGLKGTSNFIRACDGAAALWREAMDKAQRPDFARRVTDFARSLAHLGTYRPDDLGSMIRMDDGCYIELAAMLALLGAFTRSK